jgi:UbiD family decarboxylase
VARCRTVDLAVPRWAEVVIEGHILADEREREGPFGEFTGYASTRGTENVLVPTALQYREGAIYQSHNAGLSLEHCLFLAFPREILVSQILRRIIPNLKAVRVPVRSGCGSFHVYVSLRKTAEGQPKQAILAVLGADHYFKHVIVVDEDIDIYDDEQVLWAVATRVQADRDLVVVSGGMGTLLDPSSPDGTCAKLGIDATRPLSGFAERLTLPERAVARARALLGLPES